MVSSEKPNVVLLTETWLDCNIPDSLVSVPNYLLFRQDRQRKRGGGVCIYISSEIQGRQTQAILHEQLMTINNSNHDFESLWIELRIDSIKMLLSCIYRPPNCSLDSNNSLCATISELQQVVNHPTLIFGDFNFPGINWQLGELTNPDRGAEEFLDCYNNSHLFQLIAHSSPKYRPLP